MIICSVTGAAALDPKANGKISLIAFIFIISTNALGSAMGIGAVYMFTPGKLQTGNDIKCRPFILLLAIFNAGACLT